MSAIKSPELLNDTVDAVRLRKKAEFQRLFRTLIKNQQSIESATSLLMDVCESNDDYVWLNSVMMDKE